MPLFNPPPREMDAPTMLDQDILVESGTVRFFPDFELAVDATLEIPVDGGVEII